MTATLVQTVTQQSSDLNGASLTPSTDNSSVDLANPTIRQQLDAILLGSPSLTTSAGTDFSSVSAPAGMGEYR